MGVNTWMSNGVALTYRGSLSWISWIICLYMTFTSLLSSRKKSFDLLSNAICSPLLMRCALTTMSLCPACRKIFSSVTMGNALLFMRSLNTCPGPTLGSWSTSPTRMSLVPGRVAFNSAWNSWISTMDISSMITTSASNGFSWFLSKFAFLLSSPDNALFSSNSRCIVLASNPVASVILFAARPVGAARKISIPSDSK